MGVSDVAYMVRGRTEEQCRQELAKLCERMDATPAGLPVWVGERRWIARAVPMPKAPAVGEGLTDVR